MPKKSVKALVISDLHLGEASSVFSDNYTIEKFWKCIAQNYSKIGEFIILGDVLDLSQAMYPEVLYAFKQFLKRIPPKLIKKIVMIPGNHDHHIWFENYENLIVSKTLSNLNISGDFDKIDNVFARNKELREEFSRLKEKEKRKHGADKDGFYSFGKGTDNTITNFIRSNKLLKGIDLEIRYPFYNINIKNQTLHLHHGHFFGTAYNLFTTVISELKNPISMITWKMVDLMLEGLYKGLGRLKSLILIMTLATTLVAVPVLLTLTRGNLWVLTFIPLCVILLSIIGFYGSIYKRTKELKENLGQGDLPELDNLKIYEKVNAPQYEFMWYLLGQSPMHNLQEKAYELFHAHAGRSLEAGETISGLSKYIKKYLKIYSHHKLFPKRMRYLMFGHTHRIGWDDTFTYDDKAEREKKITVINSGGWLNDQDYYHKSNSIFEVSDKGIIGYSMQSNEAGFVMDVLNKDDYNKDPLKIKAMGKTIKKSIEKSQKEFKKQAKEFKDEIKKGL